MKSFRRRILVLASTYPRWANDHEPGFVHELCQRLTQDFDILVICPHAPGAEVDEVLDGVIIHRFRYAPEAFETLIQDGGILSNLKRTPWKWGLVPFFFLGLIGAIKQSLKNFRPHCVHAHWIIPQGFALALLSVFLRHFPPFVLTSHGGDLFALRGRVFNTLKSWILRKASALTVVSRPMVDAAMGLGTLSCRIDIVPMGVDFKGRFVPYPVVPRIPGQILFVGRLVEKKGVKYLIDALRLIRRRIPFAHLVIVGGGPEQERLVTQVAELGLSSCVEFRGPLPQLALPELYRQAAVFVAPFVNANSGDREGLGLVSVEAIACGCPVVVGDVPVVADIFLDSEMEMRAIPGDSENLAEKISAVLLAPNDAASRTSIVRTRLIKQMGWDSVSAKYSSILWNLCSENM